jgi:Ca-activated chloride channel family protein
MLEAINNFHFIRPFWLLLVVPVVAIWWWWQRSADPLRGWREQMDPALLEALVTDPDRGGQWRTVAPLIAWLLAVLVVAGPTWKPEPSPFAEDASSLVILLKADASMEKGDVAPSRLERARLKIADLAEARKGQPLGLMAYAGSAHLVLPPTRDTAVVGQMATEIAPDVMPVPGDHLELALAKAAELVAKQETPGSILVAADSVDGDLGAVTEAYRKSGAPLVEFLAVNEPGSSEDEALRKAAHVLNAKVVPLTTDGTDIEAIVRTAARPPVSRSALEEKGTRWQEGGWYLLPLLALLAALAFRREARKPEEAAA